MDVKSAWLTCDAADNDPSRFLGSLTAAISQITMHGAPHGARSDRPSLAGLESIGALVRCPMPFALFLDDLEHLHEPAVLGLLKELLLQLPRYGLVVSAQGPHLTLGSQSFASVET